MTTSTNTAIATANTAAAVNATPKRIVPPKVEKIALDLFGDPSRIYTFAGYNEGHVFQHLVPKKRKYVADRTFIRRYRSWHNDPKNYGFMSVGPTGSGKTTSPLAVNAMLNIPTLVVDCSGRTTKDQLICTHTFATDPKTQQTVSKHVLGPVARAFKFGFTVILDEYNLMEPDEQAGLNGVIINDTLVIEETGEVIQRHPMFRFVACGNDWGRGEGEMRYAGIKQQNSSTLNRFRKHYQDYPEKQVEIEIVKQEVPAMSEMLITGMVDVARKIRAVCTGVGKASEATLDVDFSTRTVLLWADLAHRYCKTPGSALFLGLEEALLLPLNEFERTTILQCCKDVFGEDLFSDVDA